MYTLQYIPWVYYLLVGKRKQSIQLRSTQYA